MLWHDNGFFYLKTEPPINSLYQELKALPTRQRQWNKAQKIWRFIPTPYISWQLSKLCKKYNVKFSKEAVEIAKYHGSRFDYLYELSHATEPLSNSKFYNNKNINGLMSHQYIALEYTAQERQIILADTMGLGKTIEIIHTATENNAFPMLYICPAKLRENVSREIRKWAPNNSIMTIYGEKECESYQADCIVCSYSILHRHIKNFFEIDWKLLAFDESQYLKHNTRRTRTAKRIANKVAKNKYNFVICASGTPIDNRPKELINQLQIIDKINIFENEWNFLQRYCDAKRISFVKRGVMLKRWDFSGASNTEELNKILRGNCYIRRTRKQVFPNAPKLTRQTIVFDIENRGEYNYAVEEFISHVFKKALHDEEFQKTIQNLTIEAQQEATLAHAKDKVLRAEANETLTKINELKQICALGKIESIIEWAKTVIESGESLIIFAYHKRVIKQLEEALECRAIYGETKDSQKLVDDFQNGETKVLIINIKSGIGHNLTRGHIVAFAEFYWVPTIHAQCECRVDRIGQEHDMLSYYLVGKDTIDVEINHMLQEKQEVVDSVTDGEFKEQKSKESIFSEFVGNWLDRYYKEQLNGETIKSANV